jgi:hypothetical protein
MAVPRLIFCTAYEGWAVATNVVIHVAEMTWASASAPNGQERRTARQLNLFRSEGSEVRCRDENIGVLEAVPIKLTALRESSQDGIWL